MKVTLSFFFFTFHHVLFMFDAYQMPLCIDILLLTLYPISNYEKPIQINVQKFGVNLIFF